MKKINLLLVLILSLMLTGCYRVDEPKLEDAINEKINYINEQNITIFFNSKNDIDLTALINLQSYNKLSDIELTQPYTFIGYNVEVEVPSNEDIEALKGLLEQDKNLFSVCFFGTKDFNYLKPMLYSRNLTNDGTIAHCFGNFFRAKVEYRLTISGLDFDDIVKNKLQYQNAILNYIEKQYNRYLVREKIHIN